MAKISSSSLLTSGFFSNLPTTDQSKINVSTAFNNTNEKIMSLEEVSWHDNSKDCWIIIYDRVYDITEFLHKHPGGTDILLDYAGREASLAFRGSGHSAQAIKSLDKYFIGELPIHERIFRKPGGYQVSDLPQ